MYFVVGLKVHTVKLFIALNFRALGRKHAVPGEVERLQPIRCDVGARGRHQPRSHQVISFHFGGDMIGCNLT